VNHDEYCEALRREGHDLDAAARAAGLDANVPSCPEWTVTDLLGHVGRLHRYVARVVSERTPELRGEHWSEASPPPPAELFDWFAGGVDLVADVMLESGPDAPAWSWTPDKTSGFWARRQANETAVHRYDAQLAAGTPQPVERELAVDGIDEFFDLVPFWPHYDKVRGNGETMHLHCTDGEGEWLARVNADGLVVTREHAKGDVAARGSASDLLLFLYGRVGQDAFDVFGDAGVLTTWRATVNW
jgi:uncharacterized protein (TIGR03083 family)